MADEFHAIKGSQTRTTGHYRRPGTRMTMCGRPLGARNDAFANVPGWNVCTKCQQAKTMTGETVSSGEIVRVITTGPKPTEPEVAEYQRTDPTGEPTHPAGQQAAVEGMLDRARLAPRRQSSTFERIADELNARGVPVSTPAGRLTAQMYALFEEFEQERRAEIIAAGGTAEDADDDGWGDVLSRAALVNLARDHRSAMRPEANAQQYDALVEEIADTFTLSDVRIMRGAWTAITEAMPRIAYVARMNGKSPDEIAQATGYTSSRIAQFIRQEKQRAAAPGTLHRYTWRIDVQGADGEWTDREAGEDESTPADLAQLAERLLDETGAREQRARIVMWEGDEGDDADAVHRAERPAQWAAFLTVEQHDGKEWRELSDESIPDATEEPAALARRVLDNARETLPGDTVRVRVWRFGESEGAHLAEAVTTDADRIPDDQGEEGNG
ncbi:hypothetical protein ACFWJ5_21190 [Streptomyces qaidamensis]|uniref:hypothetical protein n=1 Tax=Streptomyces qaidamensis TaxID=1783515 RepID=UPI003663B39B